MSNEPARPTAWLGWLAAAIALAALAWVWTERRRTLEPPREHEIRMVDSPGVIRTGGDPSAPGRAQGESWEKVVARMLPAVVQVETSRGLGSGFFVSADTVLTNYHVVAGESYVTIRHSDKSTAQASVSTQSRDYDVAVLKVWAPRSGQVSIPFGVAAGLHSGQEVVAIGSPRGMQNTVTRGIVSGLRQLGQVSLVQMDAALNPGNSGGPLIDQSGAAVAINTMMFRDSQGLNFSVAIEHAQALIEGRAQAPVAPLAEGETAGSGRMPSASIPTETEQVRLRGTQVLEAKLAAIAYRAATLDDAWARFMAVGFEGTSTGSFDRAWYAVWEPETLKGKPRLGYEGSFAELKRRAGEIREWVHAAEDEARRADVYPGVRRELRQKYRLDYPGWN